MKRFLILCILLLSVGIVSAQDTVTVSPQLEESLQHIEDLTSVARDLEALEPLTVVFPTRVELFDYIESVFREDVNPDDLANEMYFYRAFDLLPADLDLMQMYIDLYSDQIGGFYDTEAKVMNVILVSGDELGDQLPVLEQVLFAHEFTHALQDQHFNLDSLLTEIQASDNADQGMAILALIEGDASYTMAQFMTKLVQENPNAMSEMLAASNAMGGTDLPAGTPDVIGEELLWPYLQGMIFVTALIRDGGWETVNNAFVNLPQSTEHIYHPASYLNGDMPVAVSLVDSSDNLGTDWTLLHDRVMGEFYLRQYLATNIGPGPINRAATGWGGDRYQIYYNESADKLAWVARFVWDTPDDAAEFQDVYTQFATNRYDGESSDGCWTNDVDTTCIIQEESGAILITQAPTMEMARTLLNTQRK